MLINKCRLKREREKKEKLTEWDTNFSNYSITVVLQWHNYKLIYGHILLLSLLINSEYKTRLYSANLGDAVKAL